MKHRITQYIIIIAIISAISGAYFYFQSNAAQKINSSKVNNLTSGLVGYWTMDGQDTNWTTSTSGTIANRGSAGGNGSITNMSQTVSPVIGKVGQGFYFDGINDFISFTPTDIINTSEGTVSLWVKPAAVQNNTGFYFFDHFATNSRIYMNTNSTGTNLNARLGSGITIGSVAISADKWYHVTLVWNGTSAAFYVDGIDRTSIPTFEGLTTVGATAFIGSYSNGSQGYTGTLDEVRVYSRALVQSEITELYQQGQTKINASEVNKSTSGLVSYWTFDGADMTATTATDKSPSGSNPGTLNGATGSQVKPQPVIGKIGQGLNFDGTDDYISAPSGAGIFNTNNWTVSSWFNSNEARASKYVDIYMENYTDGYAHLGFYAWSTGRISIRVYKPPSSYITQTSTGYNDGVWHMAIATNNNGTVSLYVDGTYKSQISGSVPPLSSTSLQRSIGYSYAHNVYFNGKIDEVRTYDRALSASEITELYQQGQTKINASQANKLTSGLYGYYTMDGQDINWGTNTITDKGSGGNSGTLTSMSSSVTPYIGKIGQALKLDGVDDYIDLGTNFMNWDRDQAWTISFWGYADYTGTNQCGGGTCNQKDIFGKFDSGNDRGIAIGYDQDNGRVMFYMQNGTSNKISGKVSNLNMDAWEHYVITYDGSSSASGAKGYLNGVSQATNVVGTLTDTIINNTSAKVGKGRTSNSNAWVDEFRVYSRVLSPSEITELYNMGR